MNLSNIGSIVATEIHGTTTYSADTVTIWARFDENPKNIPIHKLRGHLVEAKLHNTITEQRPEYFISAVAFYNGDKHVG